MRRNYAVDISLWTALFLTVPLATVAKLKLFLVAMSNNVYYTDTKLSKFCRKVNIITSSLCLCLITRSFEFTFFFEVDNRFRPECLFDNSSIKRSLENQININYF